jgi:hypothetical protein
LNPAAYAPELARLLSGQGIFWSVFEAYRSDQRGLA